MWEARSGEPVTGKVTDVDQGLAQVLIGDAEEEWWFPLTTLPPHTVPGDSLLLVKVDGRYQAIKRMAGDAERSFEDRLARRLVREHIPPARQAAATGQLREPQPPRSRPAASPALGSPVTR